MKQRLLEITDTLDRLEEMLPYLRAALLDMEPVAPMGRAFVPLGDGRPGRVDESELGR